MTTDTAVTMQDLELEHAELLPARETLWCGGGGYRSSNQFNFLSGNAFNIGLFSNQSAFAGNFNG
jgi:hypothetical protein